MRAVLGYVRMLELGEYGEKLTLLRPPRGTAGGTGDRADGRSHS